MQLHSTPISETLAHVCGFVVGMAAFWIAGSFTHDAKLRLHIGMAASAIANAIVGGKINILLHDFVALILVRPLSAYLGAELIKYVTS